MRGKGWRRLTASTRLVLGRAVAPLALRALSLPQVVSLAGGDVVDGHVAADDARALEDVARAVDVVVRRLPRGRGTCLHRALARLWAARALGVPAHLVIGVRTDSGAVQAHAWLELQGALYLEEDPTLPPQFQRLYDSGVVGGPVLGEGLIFR